VSRSDAEGPGGADESRGPVERAVAAFAAGEPVLLHDAADREGETDLVYPAGAVDRHAVARLRTDAGGLVCVALSHAVCEVFDLPFLRDRLDHPAASGRPDYDARSSFSLTVNHRETHTGITDRDRALTVAALGRAAADAAAGASGPEAFGARFRAPGHVHLLRAAPAGLADRNGHTELALALADAAGLSPAAVVCEMLDAETGGALPPADARAYAEREGLVYAEGRDLIAAFRD
jgi:3,4-dihydroxy 2-butanone 4-phosphate synthase